MPNYSYSLLFLESLAGYVLCGLIAVLALAVAWLIFTGKIDLSRLISEKDGTGASMSRFQLLVFTFVVAISFFLVVISNIKVAQAQPRVGAPVLPDVPSGVLLLVGISTSSYAVGKAIQHGAGTDGEDKSAAKQAVPPLPGGGD
jgi:hypothetical protein